MPYKVYQSLKVPRSSINCTGMSEPIKFYKLRLKMLLFVPADLELWVRL